MIPVPGTMWGIWTPVTYAVVTTLHVVLPAARVRGYVKDRKTDQKLEYDLNGPLCLAVSVALWSVLCWARLMDWSDLHTNSLDIATGASLLGFVFTVVAVWTPVRPSGNPQESFLEELWCGRLWNPRCVVMGRILDAKMVLYLVGAIQLELSLLSSAAVALKTSTAIPTGAMLHTGMLSFFVAEYLYFENVHLYTFDFMVERVGFKLGWGCICFYPFFYSLPMNSTAGSSDLNVPLHVLAGSALCFFTGWILSRGANLQKFYFKTNPHADPPAPYSWIGVKHRPLKDKFSGRLVLTGGFWGLSRHINYLGEIMMGTGLAMALGGGWIDNVSTVRYTIAWLYPLYYVALLLPRQAVDDERCRYRYGTAWAQYCAKTPSRVVPGIY